nr:MAG TPA: hypothetical protein [Caudoviricetes sp.]
MFLVLNASSTKFIKYISVVYTTLIYFIFFD